MGVRVLIGEPKLSPFRSEYLPPRNIAQIHGDVKAKNSGSNADIT
jgi:hypothetical protein